MQSSNLSSGMGETQASKKTSCLIVMVASSRTCVHSICSNDRKEETQHNRLNRHSNTQMEVVQTAPPQSLARLAAKWLVKKVRSDLCAVQVIDILLYGLDSHFPCHSTSRLPLLLFLKRTQFEEALKSWKQALKETHTSIQSLVRWEDGNTNCSLATWIHTST